MGGGEVGVTCGIEEEVAYDLRRGVNVWERVRVAILCIFVEETKCGYRWRQRFVGVVGMCSEDYNDGEIWLLLTRDIQQIRNFRTLSRANTLPPPSLFP